MSAEIVLPSHVLRFIIRDLLESSTHLDARGGCHGMGMPNFEEALMYGDLLRRTRGVKPSRSKKLLRNSTSFIASELWLETMPSLSCQWIWDFRSPIVVDTSLTASWETCTFCTRPSTPEQTAHIPSPRGCLKSESSEPPPPFLASRSPYPQVHESERARQINPRRNNGAATQRQSPAHDIPVAFRWRAVRSACSIASAAGQCRRLDIDDLRGSNTSIVRMARERSWARGRPL
ncbi:hypothetical protein C8Q78DRAFT_680374 [Trametes maxima]|nr:hypothetical protein C8Q78DRAFT_680374 [Trametes maxima]